MGEAAESHSDHFRGDASDEEWLTEVGRRNWVVLPADDAIRYRKPEKQALIRAGVACFILASGNLTGDQQCEAFERALPSIKRILGRTSPSLVAKVYKDGSVRELGTPR